MAIVDSYDLVPFDESDPDDFRPNSRWALLVDPGTSAGLHVDDIAVVVEMIASGDRIPRHTHPINEVLIVVEGSATVSLGDETKAVAAGAVVFIPCDVVHGTHNTSSSPARIVAMFPSEQIGIQYVERNPAPGTEGANPQPASSIDVRSLREGTAAH